MADELLQVLGSIADGLGVAGAPVKGVRAWIRRDEARNLLRDVQRELDERWGDDQLRADLYEQVARHLASPQIWPAFEAVTRGDADALEDVREYLSAHLGVESRAGASEVAEVISDVLVQHLGRAQKTAQAAVDAVGTLRHGQAEQRFNALDERLDDFSSVLREALVPRVAIRSAWLPLDAAPSDARRALDRLGRVSSEALAQLLSAVGTPPDGSKAAALIDDPPEWVASGSAALHRALARLAELEGHWESSVRGWRSAAERESGDERAELFARAAVAARVAGDESSRAALLDEARRINKDSPRLQLEELDEDADPDTQLAALANLDVEDEELAALISAQRALAHLRQPDVSAAERELATAANFAPDAVATRALGVNIAVQQGRSAASRGEPVDGPALRHASQQAVSLREELLAQRRFGESARILMLAIDASLISSDYEKARAHLGDVRPDEAATAEGAEVLAEVAIRADEHRRALELLGEHEGTIGIHRQRATAEAYVGSSETVLAALATLDAIAAEDADVEGTLAAFARLAVLSRKPSLPWSDTAEKVLRRADREHAVVVTRSMQLARQTRFYDAEKLLEPHLAHPWAREHRLRLARMRGNRSLVREAADAVLQTAPDQSGRLECGLAYGWLGDLDDAQRELWAVARDPSAPTPVRLRAFRALLRTLLRMKPPKLTEAETALEQWRRLAPGDPNAASWDVVIASQRQSHRR
jgi:hypothetical protein